MNSKIVAHTSEEIDLHNIIIYKKNINKEKRTNQASFEPRSFSFFSSFGRKKKACIDRIFYVR